MTAAWIVGAFVAFDVVFLIGGVVGFWFGWLSGADARDAAGSEAPSRLE